jgi:macrolide transport system ATP-binding/permease protein
MSEKVKLSLRLYRALARAFPHEFQMLYGEDLERAGADAAPEVWQRHGVWGLIRLLADIALRLPGEYLSELRADTKYALRMLAKSPGFTAVAVISLALGIGVCSFFYSAFSALIFHPLAGVRDPKKLAAIDAPVPYLYYKRYRDQSGLEAAAFSSPVPFSVAAAGGTSAKSERISGDLVSPDYFAVLGLRPTLGRFFRPDTEKPGTRPVIVVSDRFWRTHLHSDPQAVGTNLRLNGQAVTILGVAPDKFLGIWPMTAADVFVPTTSGQAIAPELAGDALERPDIDAWHVVLRTPVSVPQSKVVASLDVLTRRLDDENLQASRDHNSRHLHLISVNGYEAASREDTAVAYIFIGILFGLILSLACTNLANLLLARSTARRKEIAVRLSVGAGRFRLVRQLLTESVTLSLAGGIAGFAFSYWLASVVWARNFATQVADANLRPDLHVLLVALGVAFLTGVGFGIAPALHITHTDVAATLKEGSFAPLRGYRRFGIRNLFVAYQVAASLALLLLAGFIVLGFAKVSQVNLGFDTTRLALFQLDPAHDGYSARATADLYKQLSERLLRNPAVQGVTFAEGVPFVSLFGALPQFHFYVASENGNRLLRDADRQRVGTGYFSTLGIAPLRGREFIDSDQSAASGAIPAILNQTGANEFFGDDGPIGRTLHDDKTTYTVIGVVPDQKAALISAKPPAVVFVPFGVSNSAAGPASIDAGAAGAAAQNDTLIVRGKPGSNIIEAVTGQIASIDPRLTVFNVSTVADRLHQVNTTVETSSSIYGGIGLFGMILSCIGLAGVTSYGVARRGKEIGIRVALGARRSQILGLVMKEGAILVTAGSVLGYLGAWAISRALAAITHEVADAFASSAHDPRLLIGAPLLLASLALLACYLPARRSSRIDPLAALREQ